MLLMLTDLLFFIRGSAFSLAPVRFPFDSKYGGKMKRAAFFNGQ